MAETWLLGSVLLPAQMQRQETGSVLEELGLELPLWWSVGALSYLVASLTERRAHLIM